MLEPHPKRAQFKLAAAGVAGLSCAGQMWRLWEEAYLPLGNKLRGEPRTVQLLFFNFPDLRAHLDSSSGSQGIWEAAVADTASGLASAKLSPLGVTSCNPHKPLPGGTLFPLRNWTSRSSHMLCQHGMSLNQDSGFSEGSLGDLGSSQHLERQKGFVFLTLSPSQAWWHRSVSSDLGD